MNHLPRLSIIVIVYDMPRQAYNTLFSLSSAYQRDVDPADYEVIVLENCSENTLDEYAIAQLEGNFRYVLRDESKPTPVYAINEGLKIARGDFVSLVIDGARLVTPGTIAAILSAFRLNPDALAIVPGYHLGDREQQYQDKNNYSEHIEQQLLDSIRWQSQGYKLFGISCFSSSNIRGYLQPMLECNCISAKREHFIAIGGADERFQTPGGGSVNLDIYRQLGLIDVTQPVILAGEGSFHQIHGGVTTTESSVLEQTLADHREEFKSIRGQYYSPVLKEPILLGKIPVESMHFLIDSCHWARKRHNRLVNSNRLAWPDQVHKGDV